MAVTAEQRKTYAGAVEAWRTTNDCPLMEFAKRLRVHLPGSWYVVLLGLERTDPTRAEVWAIQQVTGIKHPAIKPKAPRRATTPTEGDARPASKEPQRTDLAEGSVGAVKSRMTVDELLVLACREVSPERGSLLEALNLEGERLRTAERRIGRSNVYRHPLDALAARELGLSGWEFIWESIPGRWCFEEAPDSSTVEPADPSDVLRALVDSASDGDTTAQIGLVALTAKLLASGRLKRSTIERFAARWVLDPPETIDATILIGLSLAAAGDRGVLSKKRAALRRLDDVRAAVWAAPIAPLGPAGERLDGAVASAGLSYADPLDPPFAEVSDDLADHSLGLVAALGERRSIQSTMPEWLHDEKNGLDVVLLEDDRQVLAWVGLQGVGGLVAFDPVDPMPIGLPARGTMMAAALAMCWFVDLSVGSWSKRGISRVELGNRGHQYVPTRSWEKQVDEVRSRRRQPPMAHFVRPHVRHYSDRFASEEAQARAPESIRRHLGPRDTWVRGHWSAGWAGIDDLRMNLRSASAVADLVGLMRRAGGWLH